MICAPDVDPRELQNLNITQSTDSVIVCMIDAEFILELSKSFAPFVACIAFDDGTGVMDAAILARVRRQRFEVVLSDRTIDVAAIAPTTISAAILAVFIVTKSIARATAPIAARTTAHAAIRRAIRTAVGVIGTAAAIRG